jgi:hypothetical protein
MFNAIRRLIQGGDIRGLLDASRNAFRQFGIEIQVLKGRNELRGGKNRYGADLGKDMFGYRQEASPFSFWLEHIDRIESQRLADDFWGNIPWERRYDALREFVGEGEDLRSGDQIWNDVFRQNLQWRDWRNSGYFNRGYNPLFSPQIRAGKDWAEPLYWRQSGEPIRADGIEILPWDRYDNMQPIEMTKYVDPFFNSPTVNPQPIIDIRRRRMW